MDIDISKLVYLELRNKHGKKFSNTRLKFIGNYLGINCEFLIELSEKYKKIWFIKIDSITNLVYAITSDIYEGLYVFEPFNLSEHDRDIAMSMNSVYVPKSTPQTKKIKDSKTNEVIDIQLDLDTILDKISKDGVVSLTKKEINFLDSFSK